MSSMKARNPQSGFISGVMTGLILVSLFLVGAIGFGVWAFMGRQDYKNNVDQKIEVAQAQTKQETEEAEALKYAEEAKNPLKAHVGPSAFGSVTVAYPKTWSGYIIEDTTQGKATPVDDYFHPDVV